jgi:6,7-dimethyl-8-ribityllumazine synthase
MSDYHEDAPVEAGETAINGPPPVETPTVVAPPPPANDPVAAQEALGGEPVSEETAISEESVLEDSPDEPSPEAEQGLEEETEAAEANDPFAAWPHTESSEAVEDAPEQSATVEHVAGEIDVPDGYTTLEGTPSGHRRSVAVVVSRYNAGITNQMLARAIDALEDAGVSSDAVTIMPVPGAFELPLAAMALAKTRRYACVVALGAIIRGETPHFDYIASEAASGLQLAAIETGVPVAFGVLTVETPEQAEERIDRAADAVQTALEMADVFAQLRASART